MILLLWHIVAIFNLYCIKPAALFNAKHLSSDNYNIYEYTNLTFTHAESPVWDEERNTLYWVDALNQDVHALDFTTHKHRVKHIYYGEVNVVIPVQNSSRLLLGVRNELFLMDWTMPGDSALRLLAALEHGFPDNILNEGKVDALGRFWGGTKGPQDGDVVVPDRGALYSLEAPHFVPVVQLKPVSISNGLVWSLNNTVLYYMDSLARKVEAFDFDLRRGRISYRRTILDIDEYFDDDVLGDGMTIDEDGCIWVALMFHGSIIRIDPDTRQIVESFKLPVTLTTSLTWGGPNFENLFVTTSRRNMNADKLKEQPLAGAIFVLHNTGTKGVPSNKFVFNNADEY